MTSPQGPVTTFAEAFAAIAEIAGERGDHVALTVGAWYDPPRTITHRSGADEQTHETPGRTHGVEVSVWSTKEGENYRAPSFALAVDCYREKERDWERLVSRHRAEDVIEGTGAVPCESPS